MKNNNLTVEERTVLIRRIEAYLKLTGKSKSEYAEDLGFAHSYISNLVSKTQERPVTRSAATLIEFSFKEYGLDAIDEMVKVMEQEKLNKQIELECWIQSDNRTNSNLPDNGLVAFKAILSKLDELQNSQTVYLNKRDAQAMYKIATRFGLKRTEFIIAACKLFYAEQLNNLVNNGEGYTLPKVCGKDWLEIGKEERE